MYQISVPIMCENVTRAGRDQLLEHLKSLDARRVFLSLSRYSMDVQKRTRLLKQLREHCAFFKSHGLEVGVWSWTFWIDGAHPFASFVPVEPDAQPIADSACPTCEKFVNFACDYYAELARCGVDLIMFDDDFRYAHIGGNKIGCLCDNHMRRIRQIVGEEITREEMVTCIRSGGKNKYRDAWLQANGEAFAAFAKRLRQAVDAVDPKIRMGACACLGSWDMDGISAGTLARILAGKTKPFIRLIGAPYWAARGSFGSMLQDAVELERMESAWTRDGEIELFAEGDVYPRPRISCPASYLEIFDTAIRASGATDGILKYALDYTSSANFETGYVKFHQMNKPLYPQIDDFFGQKRAHGVRIYEYPQKIAEMDLGNTLVPSPHLTNTFLCTSARSLAACSIPTTYEGEGVCGACFGPSAYHLSAEARKNGVILDGEAAVILHHRGIDVGIAKVGDRRKASFEHFLEDGEVVPISGATVYRNELKPNVRVCSEAEAIPGAGNLSHMSDGSASIRFPMSYFYESPQGERYLVLNFVGRFMDKSDPTVVMRHYARSRQYAKAVEWLSKGAYKLPAFCHGNPNLYTMVKSDEKHTTVGLWNCFADPVIRPEILLDREYTSIRFLNCEGRLEGNTVTLTTLPAFGFATFEVAST